MRGGRSHALPGLVVEGPLLDKTKRRRKDVYTFSSFIADRVLIPFCQTDVGFVGFLFYYRKK